ncbi:MAG: ATP-binding protein [Pseudomonadota bacterium]|nr:ATP-binding protein [Pseudomonadota bacterium]
MFRTLFARLSLVLFLLFTLIGAVSLGLGLYSAQLYQQEVAQRLNLDLAAHIADDHALLKGSTVDRESLALLFHNLMVINPSVEFYLLDDEGRILAWSAAPGAVQRERVGLGPLLTLIGHPEQLPVMGDDPRDPDGRKTFSVAPLEEDGHVRGYVYAIVGSEQADDIADLLAQSYILRWSAVALLLGVLFATVAGLAIVFLLTRRLRRLGRAMDAFRGSDFSRPVRIAPSSSTPVDEIEQMEVTFAAMAGRIHSQMNSLRESDRLRRELVANVSHDLRTPLASLRGYLETLLMKEDSIGPAERRACLETASRSAERLSRLILELFELAKLDARELTPEREPFSPAELVQDVMLKFQLRARQKGIDIEVDITPDAPFVNGDIGMIERVLNNLLENALQHTPEQGCIRLSVGPDARGCVVAVADTGDGISGKDLPHVFERFYRSANRGNRNGGAGLGLAIAQRIVDLHGGKLSVHSEAGIGSVFAFDLPAVPTS